MNKQNWQNFFSIRNFFLYFALVILPLLVAYYAVDFTFRQQYQAKKDLLGERLSLQAARIPNLASDEYQFKDFFDAFFKNKNLLKSSPEAIGKVLDRIEKLYPGGFKWIFWDKNARVIPVNSKTMLEGKKSWEILFINMMKKFNLLGNAEIFSTTDHFRSKAGYSLGVLQKAVGPKFKVEHFYGARDKVVKSEWFGRECLTHWDIDADSYKYENVPESIRGGCLVMAFKEELGEDFWLKRMLLRRKRDKDMLPFPLLVINLSERKTTHIEDSLKYPGISENLLKAYIDREQSTFEFDNYLAKASTHDENSSLRIFSLVDLSDIKNQLKHQQFRIRFVFILLLLIFTIAIVIHGQQQSATLSLRKRIAILFLIAVFMPVLSLISIGRVFLFHEKNRLYESAYLQMERGLEGLELHYKDAPRLYEKSLFNDILAFIGDGPHDAQQVKAALEKAVEADLIKHYIVGDDKGSFIVNNWHDIHPAIRNAMKITIKRLIDTEFDLLQTRKSALSSVIDEEMEDLLTTVNAAIDISRPSHLRYYCFQDFHMYFMSATLIIGEKPHAIILHIPDYYIERNFVRKEFATNFMASDRPDRRSKELRSELFFYSRFKANPHLPSKAELFTRLEKDFNRSFNLKLKEKGEIEFDGERFLYCLQPLRTMFQQSYIPCMLTTTRQIEERLQMFRIAIFSLAAFASLGALILSLILAGSLLNPIRSIDAAAQLVGKGNLNVSLPELGTDELGRLSRTFNDMVKGLRERERMQAYVSDSVLEAVQDHSDHSLGAGKFIQATILFSDIRNFTGLTEQYRPDKIFSLLNEFFGGIEPLIRENHGRVDKFIGDAVMAVFHQTGHEHHSLSAIKAAVAMKKFLKNLNLKRKKEGLFPVNIGIGISTGMVLLGDVGSARRKDLTVIGDEVNLAARLETASKQGQHSRIVISGSTYELVNEHIEAEEMPFTEVRGKRQAVKIYELVRLL